MRVWASVRASSRPIGSGESGWRLSRALSLSHSGYRVDQRLAAAVGGVDVIVGGHSHPCLSDSSDKAAGPYPSWVEGPDGHRVAIVQAYAYGMFLGALTVTWDDAGIVTAAEGEPILLDGQVAEDAALKARIAELTQPLAELRQRVVGETAAPIDVRCRAGECAMGNLVADAMLDRVKGQGIGIAITNGGGLRAAIDAGPVTMGEVLTVLPFQNTLSTFRLKGADLVAALENGVSQVEDGAGRFPQVAGLRLTWTRAAPANGGRVLEVLVQGTDGWAPIEPDRLYGVVSNDYMRRGGDGYAVLAGNAIGAYDFGSALEGVVTGYLAGRGPCRPYLDGRIEER